MTERAPLVIEAVVDAAERPVLSATALQLEECLEAAAGASWPVELRYHDSMATIAAPVQPTIVIGSLLREVGRLDEPIAVAEARWRKDVAALPQDLLGVFVCTIFRCVSPDAATRRNVDASAVAERIRRLNLFAAELSHDTGIGVIDIDRVFTYVGARDLRTDYRLAGPLAADVAAHTIVCGLLAMALDDVLEADVARRAGHFHGDLATIVRYVGEARLQDGGA